MARFHGKIGYGHTVEPERGIRELQMSERSYFGDVNSISVKSETGDQIIPNLTLGHTFSVVADAYALKNFTAMRYIEWMGTRWTIVDIKVEHPRLTIRPGEVYNGPTP